MSIKSFDELAVKISMKIKSTDTHLRLSIPPLEMLAVTLRTLSKNDLSGLISETGGTIGEGIGAFMKSIKEVSKYLGSGCDQIDLHLTYRIGHTTIGKILRKVCNAIWEVLREECFPELTTARWKQISDDFQKYSQYPNCLGAIDGKHVWIRRPKMNEFFFSIVLLAIVDANYKFIYIDVGAFGKESNISLSQVQLVQICHSHLLVMRQSPDIMRPFSGKVLSDTKRIFNYRLSRARRNVECAFGIFSNKWKITCCALHNFIRTRDGFNVEDVMTIEGLIEIERDLPTNQFK
ncbi:protein ANTAGONIST OF LIKE HETEROCHROMATIN PROTEIN 1-like, partial [Aphis craccivora]